MKFKEQPQQEQKQEVQEKSGGMSKALYDNFVDLIQFEIKKLTLIESAKHYYRIRGNQTYVEFLTGLGKECKKVKCCLIDQLVNNNKEVPEFLIPQMIVSFDDPLTPFKTLAELEDKFEEELTNLINIAFEDKDWKNFYYFMKKQDLLDGICHRALSAIENKADLLKLCEQHTSEK